MLGDPRRPGHTAVRHWADGLDPNDLFTASVVIGEIAAGVEALTAGARRRRYQTWLHVEVLPFFGERVLPFDTKAALRWGALVAEGRRLGRTRPSDDAKIADIVLVHGLTVATGNIRHFEPTGVQCVDPEL